MATEQAGAGGRKGARRRLGAAAIALLALSPFLLAGAARAPSVGAPSATDAVPPLPEGAEPSDLAGEHDLEPVPLLAPVDDGPSRAAVTAFRRAGILEPAAVRAAFDAAWAALDAPAAAAPALAQLRDALFDREMVAETLQPLVDAALDALEGEPANGDRLTNAAVMLFAYGALVDAGIEPTDDESDRVFYGPKIEGWATDLLSVVIDRFGPARERTLDLALFTSLVDTAEGVERGTVVARAAVDAEPDDPLARLVLASLEARRPDEARPWDEALETLAPLLDDPATATLGHAGRGDVLLSAASIRAVDAPRTARVLARRAVTDYDAALDAVADAGLYAGRARALALLGEPDAARAAMERAVDLAPRSVDLTLAEAALAGADGDAEAMREGARRAGELLSDGWNPSAASVRYLGTVDVSIGFAHPGDLGLFGASVGSTRDHVGITRVPQGGGFLADLDVVPRVVDPLLDSWRRGGFAPDVAASIAVEASVALGEPDEARADVEVWGSQELTTAQSLTDRTARRLDLLTAAASMVATGEVPPELAEAVSAGDALGAAEAALRRAGDFAEAERVCREAAGVVDDRTAALRCVADAQVLQGERDRAADTYEDAAGANEFGPTAELEVRRGAALVAEDPADPVGRAALRRAAVAEESGGPQATALVLLAGAELEAGEVEAARAHYDLAIAMIERDDGIADDQVARASLRQLAVHARTNRGVALLRLAQDDPSAPPRCPGGDAPSPCRLAARDFDAALRIDALNAVTLMDRGWAARARGESARARRALTEAVTADPSLFPAQNDLGVLAARDGDRRAARKAFRQALRTNRDYALGWWNLGVLELRRGIGGQRAGQAALARAVELDSSLAGDALEHRTDEAVYRATFDSLQEVSSRWPVTRTYALGAALLGGVGLVTAVGRFTSAAVAGAWGSLLGFLDIGARKQRSRVAAASARIAAMRGRLPGPVDHWAPWLVTVAALAAVTVLTAWRREPGSLLPVLVGVVVATASALAVHEAGHLLAARRWGGRLVPEQWTGGTLLALLLVPARAATGPYFAERVRDADEDAAARVHAAGPVANLLLAAVAYAAFAVEPVPVLLLTSQVSLAVCAYSLLPNLPLDGQPVMARAPLLGTVLSILVTAAGAAFAVGAV